MKLVGLSVLTPITESATLTPPQSAAEDNNTRENSMYLSSPKEAPSQRLQLCSISCKFTVTFIGEFKLANITVYSAGNWRNYCVIGSVAIKCQQARMRLHEIHALLSGKALAASDVPGQTISAAYRFLQL